MRKQVHNSIGVTKPQSVINKRIGLMGVSEHSLHASHLRRQAMREEARLL